MAFDTSMYGQIRPVEIQNPLAQYAQVAQIQHAQNQNRLADLVFGEKQREIQEADARRSALAGSSSLDDAAKKLIGIGQYKPALEITKSLGEQRKQAADASKAEFDVLSKANGMIGSAAYAVMQNPTPESAQFALAGLQKRLGPELSARFGLDKVQIPQDAAAISAWANQHYTSAIDADKLLADARAKSEGSENRKNALTIAQGHDATSRANNAATVSATMRGQNMVDARSREQIAAGKAPAGYRWAADGTKLEAIPGGPAEKDKAPTEFQGKAAMFGARAEAADKTLADLEKQGVTTPGVIKSMVAGAGGMVPFIGDKVSSALDSGMNAMPSVLGGPNAKQQQVEQARRDFVNAVLRLESGASISASEFENAAKQYFPQPGDSKEVISQKARNRKLAIEGLKTNAGKTVVKTPTPAKGPEDVLKAADSILGL